MSDKSNAENYTEIALYFFFSVAFSFVKVIFRVPVNFQYNFQRQIVIVTIDYPNTRIIYRSPDRSHQAWIKYGSGEHRSQKITRKVEKIISFIQFGHEEGFYFEILLLRKKSFYPPLDHQICSHETRCKLYRTTFSSFEIVQSVKSVNVLTPRYFSNIVPLVL